MSQLRRRRLNHGLSLALCQRCSFLSRRTDDSVCAGRPLRRTQRVLPHLARGPLSLGQRRSVSPDGQLIVSGHMIGRSGSRRQVQGLAAPARGPFKLCLCCSFLSGWPANIVCVVRQNGPTLGHCYGILLQHAQGPLEL